jgi:CheY-like chemotaxis protein
LFLGTVIMLWPRSESAYR